jgi:hypothetical protein
MKTCKHTHVLATAKHKHTHTHTHTLTHTQTYARRLVLAHESRPRLKTHHLQSNPATNATQRHDALTGVSELLDLCQIPCQNTCNVHCCCKQLADTTMQLMMHAHTYKHTHTSAHTVTHSNMHAGTPQVMAHVHAHALTHTHLQAPLRAHRCAQLRVLVCPV